MTRTFAEYFDDLRGLLARSGVVIERNEVRFFDDRRIEAEGTMRFVSRSALMSAREAASFFDNLLREGRDWINIVGVGRSEQYYLVGIEYSERTGHADPPVRLAGHHRGANGSPVEEAGIVLRDA